MTPSIRLTSSVRVWLAAACVLLLQACGDSSNGGGGAAASAGTNGSEEPMSGGGSGPGTGRPAGGGPSDGGGGGSATGGAPDSGDVQVDLPWMEASTVPADTVYCIEALADAFFVGTYQGGVWRSTDGGVSFEQSNSGLPGGVSVTALVEAFGGIFAATNKGTYLSTNGGDSWSLSNAKPAGNSTALALAASDEVVFSAGQEAKIYFSSNGGKDWSGSSLPSSYDVYAAATLEGDLYVSHTQDGAYRSKDGGKTWKVVPGFGSGIVVATAAARAGDRVYVVAAAQDGSGLFESTGGDFSKVVGAPTAGALAGYGEVLLVTGKSGVFAGKSGSSFVDITSNLPSEQLDQTLIATDGKIILHGSDQGKSFHLYRRDY